VVGKERNLQLPIDNNYVRMSFNNDWRRAKLEELNSTPLKIYFRHPLDRRSQSSNEKVDNFFHGGWAKLKVPHYDDEGNLTDPYAEEGVYEPVALKDIYPEEILQQV